MREKETIVSNVPTQADIKFPVRVHWAGDVGPTHAISSIRWFIVHTTEGFPHNDEVELTDPGPPFKSAHALIFPDGELVFMVPLTTTAWTPGNDVVAEQSINVELSGFAADGVTDAQYESLAAFFNWCRGQGVDIPDEYVGKENRRGLCGHSDVADPNVPHPDPNNPAHWGGINHHTDPGRKFDWDKLIALIAGSPEDKRTLLLTTGNDLPFFARGRLVREGQADLRGVGGKQDERTASYEKIRLHTLNSTVQAFALEGPFTYERLKEEGLIIEF